jgi:hypothetical protein
MSKCLINITFDRGDRVYFGGETLRGIVKIVVHEDTKGNGIRLSHCWRTHGRGNVDQGPTEVVPLAEAQNLMAGEQLEFPFSVVVPTHPVTYRGHLTNVDHYIRVDVDVPWARNPWAEEEYVLLPGKPPAQMTGARDQLISLAEPTASMGWIGKTVIAVIAIVFVWLFAIFAFFLLPVLAIIGIYLWIRKTALSSRLGTVDVSMPHRLVAPQEPWPVSLRFTARKSFAINSITVQLKGVESATSASGSNRTTHTHTLMAQTQVLREGGLLTAGEVVDLKEAIVFPETTAYSFERPDNSIKWTAEIRIDIPRFPDWVKSEALQVVPIEFLGDQANLPDGTVGPGKTSADNIPVARSKSSNEHQVDTDFERFDFGAAEVRNVSYESSETDSHQHRTMPVPTSMLELWQQLNSVSRNNNLRQDIIKSVAGSQFDVSLIVDRVATSIGAVITAAEYSNGKTITGEVEETQQKIQVIAPEILNKEMEGLRRGDVWEVTIEITGWDTLYNRLQAIAIP